MEIQVVHEKPFSGHLMIFDLSVRGHHPSYIKFLIQGWQQFKVSGTLSVVVSPKFIEEHTDVLLFANKLQIPNVEFVAIAPEEEAKLKARKSSRQRLSRTFQEWQLFHQYARRLEATECLLPYFDTYQLPISLQHSFPCPVSGIYFRPSFHYSSFTTSQGRPKDYLKDWKEQFLISQVLSKSWIHKLFCLDPFATDWLIQRNSSRRIIALPDPIEKQQDIMKDVEARKSQLGIEPHRQVLLLFGSITERKGIYKLLEAIYLLPREECKNLCLLIVGESKLSEDLVTRNQSLCELKPVQVIQRYEFIVNEEIPAYFQMADIVLAVYQKHVGMSGILLHAAVAQKPVLCSDYGLMGELTRRYRLGITVDSENPQEISQGISSCLTAPLDQLANPVSMQQFVEANTVDKFIKAIFQNLITSSSIELSPNVSSNH
jgi:glycosyltransferase involved in cell wall biosynthesis